MKIREDYEYSGWRRLLHWINGDPKEDYMPKQSFAKAAMLSDQERAIQNENIRSSYIDKIKINLSSFALKNYKKATSLFSVIIAVVIIAVLLITVSYLPSFGDPSNIVNNEVSARYIEQGLQETGAVNIVAGIILDYRAFDTLGEAHVLFIAALSVMILLRLDYRKDGSLDAGSELHDEGYDRKYELKNDTILQFFTTLLFPIMVLYGIYIILNGHISAGGGFAGGAIIGSALILYNNAFGFKKTRRFFNYSTYKWVTFGGLITYAVLKLYSFYMGANHLDSNIALGSAGDILSSGLILPLNICVGIVVSCTMYTFFALFRKGGL